MRANLDQGERAELIVQQHVRSIEMAYPGLIAKAWPSDEEAIDALLGEVNPLIEKRREINRIQYFNLILATNERIERNEKNMLVEMKTKRETLENTLNIDKGILMGLVEAFKANGGKDSELPGSSSKRKSEQASEPPLKRARRKQVTATETESMDIEREDPVLGDQARTEAAGPEEDEEEAESLKKPLAAQIELKEDKIDRFESAGRSPSPFPGTMGAHTTAWIVHLMSSQGPGKVVHAV